MQLKPGELSGGDQEGDEDEEEEEEEEENEYMRERERRGHGRLASGSGSGTGTGSDEELDFEPDERELEAINDEAGDSSRPASRTSRAHTPRYSIERPLAGCVVAHVFPPACSRDWGTVRVGEELL